MSVWVNYSTLETYPYTICFALKVLTYLKEYALNSEISAQWFSICWFRSKQVYSYEENVGMNFHNTICLYRQSYKVF